VSLSYHSGLNILILGCGYTGRRVAERFLAQGAHVTVSTRDPARLVVPGAAVIRTGDMPAHAQPGMLVLHSVPPEGPQDLLAPWQGIATRVVYLSSTAVYGHHLVVDENTPADASTGPGAERLAVEQTVAAGPWSWLVLRPAAIYGPARGAQEAFKRGTHSLSEQFVSRIHVDDLAAHVEAALVSNLSGTWPVADEEPSTALAVSEFCARLLHMPISGGPRDEAARAPRPPNNRRVDGSGVRRALGIRLEYPSYRTGIPASL